MVGRGAEEEDGVDTRAADMVQTTSGSQRPGTDSDSSPADHEVDVGAGSLSGRAEAGSSRSSSTKA